MKFLLAAFIALSSAALAQNASAPADRPAPPPPTIHQPALTGILPLTTGMTRRSPSFGRLLTELESLMDQTRRRQT